MNVLDLFSGLGGWAEPFRDRGHDVRTLDLEPRFGCDYTADALTWSPSELGDWHPDLITASPPCEAFSVLRIGTNWERAGVSRTDKARLAVRLVERTRELIRELEPAFYVIENPRAMLRKLAPVAGIHRRTVTYCSFGEPFQKPTDLWGGFPPSLELPAPCRASREVVEIDGVPWALVDGRPCHLSSPRGSTTGIQGDGAAKIRRPDGRRVPIEDRSTRHARATRDILKDRAGSWAKANLTALRAKVPYALGELVAIAAERDLAAGRVALEPLTLFEGVS